MRHYRELSVFADELVELIIRQRPKLILTIDAKGFSIRLASRLKHAMKREGWSAPIIHTVAPTVWAWGSWRRYRFAQVFDGLLCLFPFEPDYFIPIGLESHFIGHPAAFDIVAKQITSDSCVPPDVPQIVLLPGSRLSEIDYILPVMVEAVDKLQQDFPKAIFTLLALPSLKDRICTLCAEKSIKVVDSDLLLSDTLAHCDAIIAASGTVTLEAALHGAPGVSCYRTSLLSATLGRMIVDLQKVILPNAILGLEVYPFLFQENLTASKLAQCVAEILNNPRAKVDAHRRAKMLRAKLAAHSGGFEKAVAKALDKWFVPQIFD